MRVGIVGCGVISKRYAEDAPAFDAVSVQVISTGEFRLFARFIAVAILRSAPCAE